MKLMQMTEYRKGLLESLLSISTNGSFTRDYILKDLKFLEALVDCFLEHTRVVLYVINNLIFVEEGSSEVIQLK